METSRVELTELELGVAVLVGKVGMMAELAGAVRLAVRKQVLLPESRLMVETG